MPNPVTIGIDLGTTFSVAARINENGQPEVITNQEQNDAVNIPSIVLYESDTNLVVGEAALSDAEAQAEKVIRSAKRFIGEPFTPPSGAPQDETPVKFEAKVLGAIKQYVEAHDYEIRNAVITVPAYFDFNKVNLTKEAAAIAGIEVLEIIQEPMAAAIYYCMNQKPENQKILVYDLGGGTFDTVIVECGMENGVLKIVTLADDGNHQLGGDDWDRCLMSYLLQMAHEKEPDIPSEVSELEPDDRQRLWQAANKLKIALSKNEEKEVSLKIENIPFKLLGTRKDFENKTKHLLAETGSKVDNVLKQAGLSEEEIDLVLLVGGSTFMPMVQNYVREKFGAEKVKLNTPNLAVAYGAALYASNMEAYKSGGHRAAESPSGDIGGGSLPGGSGFADSAQENLTLLPEMQVVQNASHSVGVCVYNMLCQKHFVRNMIFKGDSLPKQVKEDSFSSGQDGGFVASFYNSVSTDQLIELRGNEHTTSPDDEFVACQSSVLLSYLGRLEFQNSEIKRDDSVEITISASPSGIFADVRHPKSGLEQRIEFENKDRLTPEEIEREKQKQNKMQFTL